MSMVLPRCYWQCQNCKSVNVKHDLHHEMPVMPNKMFCTVCQKRFDRRFLPRRHPLERQYHVCAFCGFVPELGKTLEQIELEA